MHSILAYDDAITTDIYHKIYLDIDNFLSSKPGRKAVIYSLEPNSNGNVVERMTRDGVANAANYIQHGALTIIDHDLFCLQKNTHYPQTLTNKLCSTVVKLRNSYGYNDFLLFCRVEKLSELGSFASIAIFEQQLNSAFSSKILKDSDKDNNTAEIIKNNNLSIEAICVYKKKFLEARTLDELIKLVTYHTQALSYQKRSNKVILEKHKIIESIRKGFEEILGEGSSRLLLATLKLIYKIDEDRIISDPDLFFEKLNRMIGKNAANRVNPRISQHIISELIN